MEKDTQIMSNIGLKAEYLLSLFALVYFLYNAIHVFSWPSLDMASAILNWFEPGYINNDLYTDCFGERNGRYFFMLLLYPFKYLGLGWYDSIYTMTMINSALLPVAYYLGLKVFFNWKGRALLFFLIAIIVMDPEFYVYTTVGWWNAFSYTFHPSLFSITFLFFGSFLVSKGKIGKVLGLILISISTFIHPLYAFYGACFLSVLWLIKDYKNAIYMQCVVICSCIFYLYLTNSSGLSIGDYHTYFTWHFPEHYIPSRYVSLGSWLSYFNINTHWIIPFVINATIMAMCTIHSLFRKDWKYFVVGTLFLLSYSGSLLIQYLFVELYPISKIVLLASPGRNLSFGYFMVIVLVAWKVQNITCISQFKCRFFKYVNSILLLVTLVIACYLFASHAKPKDIITSEDAAVIQWINDNTSKGEVVISPFNSLLKATIPLLTGRATYYGNGVPFETKCIKENYTRYLNIYGNTTGKYGRMLGQNKYNMLTEESVNKMLPKADYLITNNPKFSNNLIKINSKYYIYKINGN